MHHGALEEQEKYTRHVDCNVKNSEVLKSPHFVQESPQWAQNFSITFSNFVSNAHRYWQVFVSAIRNISVHRFSAFYGHLEISLLFFPWFLWSVGISRLLEFICVSRNFWILYFFTVTISNRQSTSFQLFLFVKLCLETTWLHTWTKLSDMIRVRRRSLMKSRIVTSHTLCNTYQLALWYYTYSAKWLFRIARKFARTYVSRNRTINEY